MKKIIFDVDYTLLKPNYEFEPNFFKDYAMTEHFMNNIGKVLGEFENRHLKYNTKEFLIYLNQFSSMHLDEKFLLNWFTFNAKLEKQDVSDAKELLEYCKKKRIEIVALTNWFTEVQKKKLEIVDLLKYFDEVYGGDIYLKPNPQSYLKAIGNSQPSDCIMVGDTLEVDVIAPSALGIKAIHLTKKEEDHEFTKVKKLTEIKQFL